MSACAQSSSIQTERPAWLSAKIGEYESGPARQAPIEIWQLMHKGQIAYYFVSPCCDQYNPLFAASGQILCNPSGGFSGGGDGKCPKPADPGSKVNFVWAHPKSGSHEHRPPRLGNE